MILKIAKWLTRRFVPDYDDQQELEQVQSLTNVNRVLYASVFATLGLIWFFSTASLDIIDDNIVVFGLMLLAMSILIRSQFFFHFKITDEIYGDVYGSFAALVLWSAIWIFGPTAVALAIVFHITRIVLRIVQGRISSRTLVWENLRNISESLAVEVFFALLTVWIVRAIGGSVPFDAVDLESILPVFVAPVLLFVGNFITTLPIFALLNSFSIPEAVRDSFNRRNVLNQLLFTYGIDSAVQVFAILAAAVYIGLGAEFYFLYIAGFVIISVGSNRLSEAVEYNRQRSVELGKLEALGRAFLDAPPDGSELSNVLNEHVSDMFFRGLLEIRRFPDEILLHNFAHLLEWETGDAVWKWFQDNTETHVFRDTTNLPWAEETAFPTIILVPIQHRETGLVIGGIWLGMGGGSVSDKQLNATVMSLRSLSDQIAAALHSAEAYEQRLAHEKTKQELAFAGRIQASFLPDDVPKIDGWEICAVIEPANQTSGDFYDFISLPDDKLGIIVADVADKGTGAALFMALSRTLLRTFAHEYPDSPSQTFSSVNSRILDDTRSGQFVTVFYGILDPKNCTLTYASAGHNPAYMLNGDLRELKRTGIPLGMLEDVNWKEQTVALQPNLPLVMYTDGVTEAQNLSQELYDPERLLAVMKAFYDSDAQTLSGAIIDSLHEFIGDAQQADDITLVVLRNAQF